MAAPRGPIRTCEQMETAAARFRRLMAELYGPHNHEGIPQDDRLLGLLVIAEEETEFAGDVVKHL